MCGIFCIYSKLPIDQGLLNKSKSFKRHLKHRGPDDDGIWIDYSSNVILGHTRLTILDLTDSASQPMSKAGITLSYNGEIYNYKEIRNILKSRGYVFTSSGDTEVVLYAWMEWKNKSFDMFDGMFSIIIYDGGLITCATDCFGEKTLYYTISNDCIYISSELSSLVKTLDLEVRNDDVLDTLFILNGYIPSPETYYKNTYRMGTAEILEIRDSKVVNKTKYWELPELESCKSLRPKLSSRDVSLLRRSIIESLESRLHSDTPMCLFLSAGVDSSLIAAILKFELNYDIDCVTASFGSSEIFDESKQAADVAGYLGMNHYTANIKTSSYDRISTEIVDHYGQPFDTLTTFAMSDMTRTVRDKYKVGLTGFGGDEIFFGYGKHAYAYRYRILTNSPYAVRSTLGSAIDLINFKKNTRLNNWTKMMINVKDSERYLAMKLYPTINTLRGLPCYNDIVNSMHHNINDIVKYTYTKELTSVMPNSRCISSDLGSMNSGFEFRTPFLSRKIINATHSMDYRSFMSQGQKTILKKILSKYLPDDLINRPKRGFIFPQKNVIKQFSDNNHSKNLDPSIASLRGGEIKGGNWTKLAVRAEIINSFKKNIL